MSRCQLFDCGDGSCVSPNAICDGFLDCQISVLDEAGCACLSDEDCLNMATCDVIEGECICLPGYMGPKCGAMDPAHSVSTVVIAVSVVGGVVILFLVIIIVILLRRKFSRRNRISTQGHIEMGERSKQNEYIGVSGGKRTEGGSGSLLKSTNCEPKEVPRERLHVMEQLGAGSFAIVNRAVADGIINKGIMTTVAVKMLKPTATETDKSDFDKERNMYINLGYHPNVVTMLGFCTEQEPFFLIMEYLPNGNLQSYLRHIRTGAGGQYFELKEEEKRNFLMPSEIMSFANMVACGMEFLSSKSCIHRDLATRNILLGDDLVAKVSDFGLARDIQDEHQYEMKSRGRVPVRWMAPESLLDNIYTTKSDVWGYAVLMWELVTLGSHPYPGMSSRQVIDEIKNGYRLPKPEHCSEEIFDLMKRCWNENPDNRPTFTEICNILNTMMADANDYLIMSDLNKDDYLYLEPNQTKSVNTTDDF